MLSAFEHRRLVMRGYVRSVCEYMSPFFFTLCLLNTWAYFNKYSLPGPYDTAEIFKVTDLKVKVMQRWP